jgi:hypothetical protein
MKSYLEDNWSKVPYPKLVKTVKSALKREKNLRRNTRVWREILSLFEPGEFISSKAEREFYDSLDESFMAFRGDSRKCDTPRKVLWQQDESEAKARNCDVKDGTTFTVFYRKIFKEKILGVFPDSGEIIYID